MGDILVSIICGTFNHEKYIADAIESFLMQKTTFKYEILIHDDASTDRTAEIIKEYEAKYPDIIKPIYQKENQYSKGVKVGNLNRKRAKGKYIAICEGDDYWIDSDKLQKQIAFLEKNPEYSLCVHAAKIVDAKTKKELSQIRPATENRIFSTKETICGGGGLFSTNSMVYRRKESEILPDFYNNASVGDYPLTIFLSIIGKVYYMDEFMSTYRTNIVGSWTNRNLTDVDKTIKHYYKINKMLDEVNNYTQKKYEPTIKNTKLRNEFKIFMIQENYKKIKSGELKKIYDNLRKSEKIIISIKQYLPFVVKLKRLIKRKLK